MTREYGYRPEKPIPVTRKGRPESEYRDGMCRPCNGFRGYHTCKELINTDLPAGLFGPGNDPKPRGEPR